jgi:predicted amidohydrolase
MGLGTAESWRSLNRTFAQLTTSYVIFVNRVGVDESITFWGGSEVVGPDGDCVFRAPTHDEGLYVTQIHPAQVRRERIASPLLRDERPEVVMRQLDQILGERLERDARSAKRP